MADPVGNVEVTAAPVEFDNLPPIAIPNENQADDDNPWDTSAPPISQPDNTTTNNSVTDYTTGNSNVANETANNNTVEDNSAVQGNSPSGYQNEEQQAADGNGGNQGSVQTPSVNAPVVSVAGKANNAIANNQGTSGFPTYPGRRLQNPLGDFSSYTYQISLYMITAEASQLWSKIGPGALNGTGVYLVAQSGGINNSGSLTTNNSINVNAKGPQRAPYFNLDVYIDNLQFTTQTMAKVAQNSIAFSFDIVEPYGFSFVTNLTEAARVVQSSSKLQANQKKTTINPLNQQYILAVSFHGYDSAGNLVTNSSYQSGNRNSGLDNTAVFERFYSLKINNLQYTLGPKITQYHLKGFVHDIQIANQISTSILRGPVSVAATTVADAINGASGLLTKINSDEVEAVLNGAVEYPNKYSVVFAKGAGIDTATLIDKTRDDIKEQGSTAPVQNSSESNVGATEKNTKTSVNKITTNYGSGSSIVSCIESIITSSSYIQNSLSTTVSNDPDSQNKTNPNPKPIQWFCINPIVKPINWDNKRNSWAYDITYQITPYQVPYVRSVYNSKNVSYYGPVKRYDYFFTGKNSEVIGYEQRLNSLYFQEAVTPNKGKANYSVGDYNTAPVGFVSTIGDGTMTFRPNHGTDAENSIKTSVYSPGDQALAKIEILGDPDYLDQSIGALGISSLAAKNSMYGRDFTINANHGQVFIEVNFNETIDYNPGTGLLTPNSNIKFWNYPPELTRIIKGIAYKVRQVTSKFSNGKFTQTLDCIIPNFPGKSVNSTNANTPSGYQNEDQQNADGNGSATPSGYQNEAQQAADGNGARVSTDGSIPQNTQTQAPADTGGTNQPPAATEPAVPDNSQVTVPTDTGPVADDDANYSI